MFKTIFYVPNLINYVRFILLIIVIYSIPKYPLRTFVINLLAGNLDMIDGIYARSFNQRSKFGALMDHGMDRLATSIIFVYLAVRFKKIWYVFLTVQFVELVMDILMAYVNHYKSVIDFIRINAINDDGQMLEAFKTELIGQAIKEKIISPKKETIAHQNLVNFVLQLVWYSGDTFYWILYSYLFIGEKNILLQKKNGILASYQVFLQSFYDGIINLINRYFPKLFSYKMSPRLIRIIFMLVFHYCLVGAFLKFYLDLVDIFNSFREVLTIENDINPNLKLNY